MDQKPDEGVRLIWQFSENVSNLRIVFILLYRFENYLMRGSDFRNILSFFLTHGYWVSGSDINQGESNMAVYLKKKVTFQFLSSPIHFRKTE